MEAGGRHVAPLRREIAVQLGTVPWAATALSRGEPPVQIKIAGVLPDADAPQSGSGIRWEQTPPRRPCLRVRIVLRTKRNDLEM